MIKENKLKVLISSIIIVLPVLFGLTVWDKLPEKIATHWGPNGNPDAYSGKAFAVIFLPLLVLVLHWFCLFATQLDPKNKGQNTKVVALVFWICPAISVLCSGFTYLSAFDIEFNIGSICVAFMGLLFIAIGNYMPKCKQNYTIGLKIPWTLESEENWYATHRFAGRVWVIGGVILLPCAFLPIPVLPWALVIIIPLAVLPMIYSYMFYKKHK